MNEQTEPNVQGEGDYEGNEDYVKRQAKFQRDHDVEELGEKAKEALDDEGDALRRAEKAGKARKKS